MTQKKVLFIIAIIPFVCWCFGHLDADLWYDESWTLTNFVLQPWSGTLMNYPLPNNHVFYSMILQLFTRIFSLRDTDSIVNSIVFMRSFHILITVAMIAYMIKFVKLFSFQLNSNLLIVLLFTTLPFLNFSLQIRGYHLSALLLLMLMYYLFQYIKNGNKAWIWIPALCALLFYTIPSNLYFLVPMGVGLMIILLRAKKKKDELTKRRALLLIALFVLGGVIGLLLYSPVIENVFFNEFSNRKTPSMFYVFELIPTFVNSVLSQRYLLILLMIPGLIVFYKKSVQFDRFILLILICTFAGSFFLAFIHQKEPFDRTFVPLIPLLIIIIGIGIQCMIEKWSGSKNVPLVVVFTYCIITFFVANYFNNKFVANTLLVKEEVLQNTYSNYFLVPEHNFSRTIQFIKKEYNCSIITYRQIDYPSNGIYLSRYQLNSRNVTTMKEIDSILRSEHQLILLTTYPKSTKKQLDSIPSIKQSFPNTTNGVINVIELNRK